MLPIPTYNRLDPAIKARIVTAHLRLFETVKREELADHLLHFHPEVVLKPDKSSEELHRTAHQRDPNVPPVGYTHGQAVVTYALHAF